MGCIVLAKQQENSLQEKKTINGLIFFKFFILIGNSPNGFEIQYVSVNSAHRYTF